MRLFWNITDLVQIMRVMPIVAIKTTATMIAFTEQLDKIASFKFLPSQWQDKLEEFTNIR